MTRAVTPFHGPLAATLTTIEATAKSASIAAEPASFWERVLVAPDQALPLSPATDRAVWDLRTGRVDHVTVAAVRERAERERPLPWPQPRASAAARVHRDGDRVAWETPAFARQHRLTRAAVVAATTAEAGWIDEVADGVMMLCEQSSWCWPAHDDVAERHGWVLADVDDPCLDLGAGEAVALLAWIDQLLGAELDERMPGLRQRVRREAHVRVFEPFLTRRDWHWIGLDGDVHNWNPWIHGNVLTAALRLLDAPEQTAVRARVVALAVEGLDRYVAALPADGAIDEGYEYWWNGACRALEALDVLAHATGGAVDLIATVPALRETVAFPHRMHLGDGWFVNIADGQAHPVEPKPWHSLHRAAVRVGDDDARRFAASHRRPDSPVADEHEGAGRLLRAMTDADWLSVSPASSPLPRDIWLPSIQVLVARPSSGSAEGLTLVAKGGHNGEHHNHNDVGSFIVASDSVPVLVDAGRPTYTKQTFGPGRYDIWTMQSQWHNLPEVAGRSQSAGSDFAASEAAATWSDAQSELTLEMSGAYDVPALERWTRQARLDRTTGTVRISDAWTLNADAPVVIRLLVAGAVEVDDDMARIIPVQAATPVRLRWPAGVPVRREVRELDDPMLTHVWGARLTRLEFDVAARSTFAVTVERDDRIIEDQQ